MAGKLKWRGTARFIDFIQFLMLGWNNISGGSTVEEEVGSAGGAGETRVVITQE
jgi:hypothetical protein